MQRRIERDRAAEPARRCWRLTQDNDVALLPRWVPSKSFGCAFTSV
jgi:hypothetical protein